MIGLAFLSPVLLVGLVAVAIPIILHFIGRFRKRIVYFPTLKFLREMQKKTIRRVQLLQILLLCVRIACLAIFALLISKPILKGAGRLFSSPGTSTGAVFIMDNSPSLGYKESGIARFQKTKDSAIQLLNTVSEGGASVLMLDEGETPNPVVLNSDISHVKEQIQNSEVSMRSGKIESAINDAVRLLKMSPVFNKEIFLLTDLQRTSWESVGKIKLEGEMKNRTRFAILNFGSSDFSNVAVTSVNVFPRICTPGRELKIYATVSNFSQGEKVVPVSLFLDGRMVSRQVVSLAGNSSGTLKFTEKVSGSGRHDGYIEIEHDSLPQDDRRNFSFEVKDKLEILFVIRDLSDASLREGVYLAAAMNPQESKTSSPFSVSFVSTRELSSSNLSGFASVILFNVPQLNPSSVSRLCEYMKQGGSTLFFLGDKINRSYYNNVLCQEYSIFPGEILGLEEEAKGKGFVSLSVNDWRHPVFSSFLVPGSGDPGSAHFFKFWRMKPAQNVGVKLLASFSNGSPVLIEKEYGRGKVMVFTGLPLDGWNDFYLKPVFVAFIHELIYYLLPGGIPGSNANLQPGESDLSPINLGNLRSHFEGFTPVVFDAKNPKIIDEILTYRQGVSLRYPLVYLLIVLLLTESFLSNLLVGGGRKK